MAEACPPPSLPPLPARRAVDLFHPSRLPAVLGPRFKTFMAGMCRAHVTLLTELRTLRMLGSEAADLSVGGAGAGRGGRGPAGRGQQAGPCPAPRLPLGCLRPPLRACPAQTN